MLGPQAAESSEVSSGWQRLASKLFLTSLPSMHLLSSAASDLAMGESCAANAGLSVSVVLQNFFAGGLQAYAPAPSTPVTSSSRNL